MKKRVWVTMAIIALLLLSVGALSACNNTRTVYFTKQTYEIYLDESDTLTPEVVTSPRGRAYSLTSSNESLLKVNDDGVSVTALKKDSAVILTATSGELSATANVLIFASKGSASAPTHGNDGKYLVYFNTVFGSVVAQRVLPGECAAEPTPPERAGYTLFGWYLDSDFKTPYNFDTPVTSDIYLYALWAYSEPEFEVEYFNQEPYLSGFKYKLVPYKDIVLPTVDASNNKIVGIKDGAFAENASINSVVIPDGYKSIGEYAFSQCSSLKSITISGDVESIGLNAFADCTSLESAEFKGNGLKTIATAAFVGCTKLNSLTLPDSLESLGLSAFKECSSLPEINIPDLITTIPAECFYGTAITAINLNNVSTIHDRAFFGATKLKTVEGGDKLEDVGIEVFGSLSAANIGEATEWLRKSGTKDVSGGKTSGKVTYLGKILLYVHGVETKPEPIYVRADTVSIAGQAFADVDNAIAVFPTNVPPTYGASAFGVGTPKVDIIVPNGTVETYTRSWLVTTMDEDGYYVPNAYSLQLIQKIYTATNASFEGRMYYRYPLKSLDDNANAGVYFSKLNAHAAGDPYAGLNYNNQYVYYLLDSYAGTQNVVDINAYIEVDQNARGESRTAFLEKVASYAFYSNTSVTEVRLPNRTLKIDNFAFYSCSRLTDFYMTGASAKDEGKIFVAATVGRYSFHMLPSFYVHVPAALESTYRSGWSSIPGRITAYN